MNTTHQWRQDQRLMWGAWLQAALDVLFRNRAVPRKQLFVQRLWVHLGDCGSVVTMFLSAVTFAKSKSNENKSPLCGTEENTLPLNNGSKTNMIYK
ncbi:39S ribosomal protein L33, mitochondrial isoform X3 [Ursus maritimus]|uniref:39S ribosomal protein L33, mitochondrial isoform X3 n=1 Tax=Ursus maritimus TaxID=29073 RepID=A0A8M1F6B1_URSMA|nr:39S ribosomal protein L33, mitochondrial isoform X3 [Ursus maritimus]